MTSKRLQDIAYINQKTLPETTPPSYEFKYIDISAVSEGKTSIPSASMRFSEAPSRARRLANPGDVLVSTVRTYLRAISSVPQSNDQLVFSTGFAVLHAGPQVDERYLTYNCLSQSFIQEVEAISVGVSYPATNPNDLGKIKIRLPALEEQRRIADFLDIETSRIDSLRRLRMKQSYLLTERTEAEVLHEIQQQKTSWLPLRRLGVSVTTGPFGSSLSASEYITGGIPVVNPSHIKGAKIFPNPHETVSGEVAARLVRHALKEGDVVIGRKRDLGRGALIDSSQAGWICGSDSIAIDLQRGTLDGEYLSHVFSLKAIREQLMASSSSATSMPSLNEGNLLSLRIPYVKPNAQKELVRKFEDLLSPVRQLRNKMANQADTLLERRQALITAAVTGQLDVTTARPTVR